MSKHRPISDGNGHKKGTDPKTIKHPKDTGKHTKGGGSGKGGGKK